MSADEPATDEVTALVDGVNGHAAAEVTAPPEKLAAFRREWEALNHVGGVTAAGLPKRVPPQPPRPSPRRDEVSDLEQTMRIDYIIATVREQLAADEAARPQLGAEPTFQRRTLPLAGTAALVLVVLIAAGLAGWLGYLYFTHGGAQ